MNMEELYNEMVEKAKKSSGFKTQLLDNPKGTIKKEFNVDFGDDVQVSVYQSTPEHRHYVIPLSN